ncbi:glucoside xylosyltransferase 1 isoform X3 [Mirounga angustirostris]|uniref:glucoside xylosyltransferase 1 isoform X3 n=1 Tax=Mirounga leonina TaxID=9715 RepID=UPI00156C19EC|nr:glucoside xylosyltransferase 1 isoform X3 [Mirounga leonina]XP_045729576.1 glucoside xylosyltransferase 1 isoform X3 [Mirounga angustirostris]
MRRYLRIVVLCLACGFCSLLYAFSQLAVSLEEGAGGGGGKPQAAAASWLAGGGRGGARGVGSVGSAAHPGPSDRCKDFSLCYWNPYWMLPSDVCGMNCFWEAAFRYSLNVQPIQRMHLAVVACGERLEETVTMLKSAIIFSIRPLQFHIFAEDQLHDSFKGILILKEVDSLLYVDTDILFLRPVDDIWSLLKKFNSTQIAAMAPEHEEPRIGWYNRFARHPYYGKTGVNSGVMLMNMTRMRRKYFKNDMTTVRLRWGDILMPLLKKYKLNITWGDQDLLNIIFFHNPESLFVFPCQWNYRPDHCIYGSNCQEAEEEGIFILHGNRGVYHDDKQPAFRAIYEALRNCSFKDDNIRSLLKPLELELQKTVHTYCGKIYKIFIKQLTKSIQDRYDRPPKER